MNKLKWNIDLGINLKNGIMKSTYMYSKIEVLLYKLENSINRSKRHQFHRYGGVISDGVEITWKDHKHDIFQIKYFMH